jgi:PAS domain-containing protein
MILSTMVKITERKDGTIIPVELRTVLSRDESGQPNSMWAIVREITERKRAEKALRESEQRFRMALRNAPVSLSAQDCDLRFIWAYNQRSARQEEIIGKFDADLFTPREAARLTTIKRRVLEENVELRERMWLYRPIGHIWEESEPGKGATFYFTLPINPGEVKKSTFILLSPSLQCAFNDSAERYILLPSVFSHHLPQIHPETLYFSRLQPLQPLGAVSEIPKNKQ